MYILYVECIVQGCTSSALRVDLLYVNLVVGVAAADPIKSCTPGVVLVYSLFE